MYNHIQIFSTRNMCSTGVGKMSNVEYSLYSNTNVVFYDYIMIHDRVLVFFLLFRVAVDCFKS